MTGPIPDGAFSTWGLRFNDEITADLVFIGALGGGRRYEVVEAWDRILFTRVVAKLLRPDHVDEERSRAALRREGEIGTALAHPNLVRLLRWRDDERRPHLVLELVEAPSVEDHLEGVGPVSVPETCVLGIRMLAALHYMHANGVLHLDVKPANIAMGAPPRLLDLSLARRGLHQRLDRSVGTAAYMSPEQCRREDLGPKTDLWGLGATLYEAITGMQPFSQPDETASEPEARYPQLAEEAMPLRLQLPQIPRGLDEIVMRCLDRDPRRRPSSAVECAAALARVLDELGIDELRAWPRGLKLSAGP